MLHTAINEFDSGRPLFVFALSVHTDEALAHITHLHFSELMNNLKLTFRQIELPSVIHHTALFRNHLT